MNFITVILQIAKANYYDQLRRDKFFLTLLATLALIIAAVPPPNAHHSIINLGEYRLLYDSAWIGSLVAVLVSMILALPGYFLIHGSLTKDNYSGLHMMLNTSSLSKFCYLTGKFIGNVTVLLTITAITVILSVILQLNYGEENYIRLWSLISPFVLITFPVVCIIAAISIIFEIVFGFSGKSGIVLYVGLFIGAVLFSMNISSQSPTHSDILGLSSIGTDIITSVKEHYPAYQGALHFGLSVNDWNEINTPVRFESHLWSVDLVFNRMLWLFGTIAAMFVAGFFFLRYQTSGLETSSASAIPAADSSLDLPHDNENEPTNAYGNRNATYKVNNPNPFHLSGNEWVWLTVLKRSVILIISGVARLLSQLIHFSLISGVRTNHTCDRNKAGEKTYREEEINIIFPAIQKILIPITSTENLHGFEAMVKHEVKKLLTETPWWWLGVAGVMVLISPFVPFEFMRGWLFPFSWIWPLFIWSKLGMRVSEHFRNFRGTSDIQKDFLFMQALWSVGVIVALVTGAGAGIRFVIEGEWSALAVWFISAAFIPSLAFVLSIWTTTNYSFEGTYVVLWLFGCASKKPMLDFMGTVGNSIVVQNPLLYLLWTVAIISFVAVGTQRLLERRGSARLA